MRAAWTTVLLALAARGAPADTKIVYAEAGGDARTATVVYVGSGCMRMDLPDAESGYVLFDAAAGTLVSVDPDARTYAPLDPEAVGRLTAQLAAAQLDLGDAMANSQTLEPARVGDLMLKPPTQ